MYTHHQFSRIVCVCVQTIMQIMAISSTTSWHWHVCHRSPALRSSLVDPVNLMLEVCSCAPCFHAGAMQRVSPVSVGAVCRLCLSADQWHSHDKSAIRNFHHHRSLAGVRLVRVYSRRSILIKMCALMAPTTRDRNNQNDVYT